MGYGEEKSAEEWEEYVAARLAGAAKSAFSSKEALNALSRLCYAQSYQRMTPAQEKKFRAVLRQAVPYLRERRTRGEPVSEMIVKTVLKELGKCI